MTMRNGGPRGQAMSTRATLDGERLVVATTGHRGSDYTATFDPMDGGRSLEMTRTIDDESSASTGDDSKFLSTAVG